VHVPTVNGNLEELDESALRSVKYTFPAKFLKFNTVKTSLEFKVDAALPEFRMIEQHCFKVCCRCW
jgi:hypothetical protein